MPPFASDVAAPWLAPLPWLAIPLGLLLIGVSLLDVFLTVLHVQAESPFSNRLNRVLWSVLLTIGRLLPERARDELLGWGAPLMIGGILACWSMLYIVGFALVYLPFIHTPAVFSLGDGQAHSAIVDALYFSALSFFTIGYGDIVPVHALSRLLGVLEGALGLVTLSLSVTYLLSVYPLIARKTGLAEALNQESAGRSDGVVLAERYVRGGSFEALAQRLSGINDSLMTLGQSHTLYPVLYYVRPRDVHLSFVRVLAILQGTIGTLRYGLDPETYPAVVDDPRLLVLEEGLLSTLHTLAASSHLATEGANDDDAASGRADHLALIEELRAHGLAAVSPDDRRAADAHMRFRAATDHYIRAYAANSGYDVGAARARYSRWDRDTALVAHDDVAADRVHASLANDPDRESDRESAAPTGSPAAL